MNLDDPRWGELRGAYGRLHDPRPALARLERGESESAWSELWQELHHQGTVDIAGCLELCRAEAGNPYDSQ